MYDLNIFDICHVRITWNDVYFGIKNGFLNLDCVRDYALRCIELNEDVFQEVIDLAWPNKDELSVIEIIKKILDKEQNFNVEKASMKWQYCIIKHLESKNLKPEELHSKLNELYADFNYPEDMEEFISYMPTKDGYNPTEHSKDENNKRILQKVADFLEKKNKK